MESKKGAIEFYLNSHSGVAPYLQLVHQVKQALQLGILQVGDQLPTMREVVSKITINPNTVFKAYRTLELEGLVGSRPGLGTFIVRTLTDSPVAQAEALRQPLMAWFEEARAAGLQEEGIRALFEQAWREFQKKEEESIA